MIGVFDSSEIATASSPEFNPKYTAVSAISGKIAAAMWMEWSIGDPPSSSNTHVATPSDSAGCAALKSIRRNSYPRRQVRTVLSSARATIAGAGPKSIAEAMKKVSEAEMSALTPGILTAHTPATRPSAAKTSELVGGGATTIEKIA